MGLGRPHIYFFGDNMSNKITRDEFEFFKKEVREQIGKSNERRFELEGLLDKTTRLVSDQTTRIRKMNDMIAASDNEIKMLQPRIADVLSKDKVISSLTAEIEDMRTERIVLKTRILNLTQELNELKEEPE